MDLSHFFDYLHAGASAILEEIIHLLPNKDLKALRLCLPKTLSDALFPFMFRNLYLSIQDEDHEVFRQILDHPEACKKVRQILWDAAIPVTASDTLSEEETGSNDQRRYTQDRHAEHICFDRDPTQTNRDRRRNLPRVQREFTHQPGTYRQAVKFRLQREKTWTLNASQNLDLNLLREAVLKLTGLCRITVLAEEPYSAVSLEKRNKIWNTPQARSWSRLPFSRFLPSARIRDPSRGITGYERMVRQLSVLCKEGIIKIGSIIIDSYAPGHKTDYRDFDVIVNGHSATLPDTTAHLTLRLIIEDKLLQPCSPSPEGDRSFHWPLDTLCMDCQTTLEEITYCHIDLAEFHEHYATETIGTGFRHPSDSPNLHRVRFYSCRCPDLVTFLLWLHRHTAVKHVELERVITQNSWYTVMDSLKREGVVFDTLEVRTCTSSTDAREGSSGPEALPPWSGASEHVLAWLRGETDVFPLRCEADGWTMPSLTSSS